MEITDVEVTRSNAKAILGEYGMPKLVLVQEVPKVGDRVVVNIHGTDRPATVVKDLKDKNIVQVSYKAGSNTYTAVKRWNEEVFRIAQ